MASCKSGRDAHGIVAWNDRSWILWVIVIARTLAIAAIGVMFLRRLWALDTATTVRSHRSV